MVNPLKAWIKGSPGEQGAEAGRKFALSVHVEDLQAAREKPSGWRIWMDAAMDSALDKGFVDVDAGDGREYIDGFIASAEAAASEKHAVEEKP